MSKRLAAKPAQPRRRRRYAFRLAAVLLALGLGAELYVSNFVLQVTRLDVSLARLPEGFSGYRVAHLSDLHGKSFGENNAALLTQLEREAPDLIALTGDLIDAAGQLDWAEGLLGRLTEIAPVYYVTGNHEWGADYKASRTGQERVISRLRGIMEAQGAVWLDNAFVTLERGGDSIVLAGLVDPNGPLSQTEMEPLVSRIRAQGDPFILMLAHRYDRLEEYAAQGLDLVLSGHAHGGVIRLPFTEGVVGPGRVLFPKQTGGLYRLEDTVMAVSRGLGDTGVPRFRNRPDVTILTLVT